jgi:hypothetical protein
MPRLLMMGKGLLYAAMLGGATWLAAGAVVHSLRLRSLEWDEDSAEQPIRRPHLDPKRWETGPRVPDELLDGSRPVRVGVLPRVEPGP